MKNLWSESEAKAFESDLDLRVYSSRLLGTNKQLVLHGGGNTSVKVKEENLFGEQEELLYVKGSGWDLETIETEGFSPVNLEYLKQLAGLSALPDSQMVNEMVTHMTRAFAPVPSVEAILHAILPFKYVDHTHADSVVTITNTPSGEERIQEIYGDLVIIIPYIMPGFDLARLCAELFPKRSGEHTIGMILLNHGVFSFGATAKESYERMIQLVSMAEDYLKEKNAWTIPTPSASKIKAEGHLDIAELRKNISILTRRPMIVSRNLEDKVTNYINRDDIGEISQQGPATPDHVIRTKRLPMLGQNLKAYRTEYEAYFEEFEPVAKTRKTMLDPAPRMVLDKHLGMLSIGKSAKDAAIVSEIYEHTITTILRSEMLEKWTALPAKDIFDVEYWELEQAKLNKGNALPSFTGEIALITGAASGIGRACVDSFLSRGAAVVGVDINPEVEMVNSTQNYLGVQCDLTNEEDIIKLKQLTVNKFGGLDMLVLNAGIFPKGSILSKQDTETWKKVMEVNLTSNLFIMRECCPLLELAPQGGRVVVIGSKNVPAPGPGAAAYSASKAAMNQLARVAALEWGENGIRVNSLHPNGVFDTGIWTDEILSSRAAHYGVSVDDYKRRNVLRTEVTSGDVAELTAVMCEDYFSKTTGAQIAVDGGNDRVI